MHTCTAASKAKVVEGGGQETSKSVNAILDIDVLIRAAMRNKKIW